MTLGSVRGGRDWREALAAIDPSTARAPGTLHAVGLLRARGLHAEAVDAMREFLERFPYHLRALHDLRRLLELLGRKAETAEVAARIRRAEVRRLALEPAEHPAVEEFLLAAEDQVPPPARAPVAYVAALFDDYADRFDAHLCRRLSYRAPELIREAVLRVAGRGVRDLDVLDLGCGTGLAGELLRPLARRLDGVDLSPRMLARAADRGVYDRLVVGDLAAHLDASADRYDLVVAADVFVYLGDLGPVLAAVRRTLRAGGWLAFTVEAAEAPDYRLQAVRRYAHAGDYLARAAIAAGYGPRYLEEAVTRTESGSPVRSFVCVLGDAGEAGEAGGSG